MREITVILDDEIEKAKKAYEDAISGNSKQEVIEELQGKLGNLEVIKEEYGSFTITFKKFTMREEAIIQESAIGISGGIKSSGAGFISNPSIYNSHLKSIMFGLKSITPLVFDFKNTQAISELDKTIKDWIYDWIDEFNTKNWMFRKTAK